MRQPTKLRRPWILEKILPARLALKFWTILKYHKWSFNQFGEIVPNYQLLALVVKAILSERLYEKSKGFKQLGDHPVPEVFYSYGELHPKYHAYVTKNRCSITVDFFQVGCSLTSTKWN